MPASTPKPTSTVVLQSWRPNVQTRRLGSGCLDEDGALYYIVGPCVYRSFPWKGRYTPATVLAGSPDSPVHPEPGSSYVDGDAATARFCRPTGMCLHPLDHSKLLVMDQERVRQIDTADGATTTLAFGGAIFTQLGSCASGCGPYVWAAQAVGDQHQVLRLDMRSLQAEALSVAGLGSGDQRRVLCVDAKRGHVVVQGVAGQLLMLCEDGTGVVLAGTAQRGYRDGAATQAQFGDIRSAALAGDGSIVVADMDNRRLRLVSPEGVVSTLAGNGKKGHKDGTPLEASFSVPLWAAVSRDGDLLVGDVATPKPGIVEILVRVVRAGLQPPPHLVRPPAPPHPAAAMTAGLLESGLLADAVVRVRAGVSARAGSGERRQHQQQQPAFAAAGGADGTAAIGAGGGGGGSSAAACGGEAGVEAVDIPCHRNILAAASPYFKALFAGPLAQQGHASVAAASGSGSGAPAAPAVVTVDDAGVDAVGVALRHMYTGGDLDLQGSTPGDIQDVLCLAQQWGLDGLFGACQAYVAKVLLGPGNAAEWLVCAHLRQYGSLRRAALCAVVEHFTAIEADEAQMALLEAHPKLLLEAMGMAVRGGGSGDRGT